MINHKIINHKIINHKTINSSHTEREVDRKDAIVQMLTRDLDDAEEQFQTAQRTHMDKMHKFIQLHSEKTMAIEVTF